MNLSLLLHSDSLNCSCTRFSLNCPFLCHHRFERLKFKCGGWFNRCCFSRPASVLNVMNNETFRNALLSFSLLKLWSLTGCNWTQKMLLRIRMPFYVAQLLHAGLSQLFPWQPSLIYVPLSWFSMLLWCASDKLLCRPWRNGLFFVRWHVVFRNFIAFDFFKVLASYMY